MFCWIYAPYDPTATQEPSGMPGVPEAHPFIDGPRSTTTGDERVQPEHPEVQAKVANNVASMLAYDLQNWEQLVLAVEETLSVWQPVQLSKKNRLPVTIEGLAMDIDLIDFSTQQQASLEHSYSSVYGTPVSPESPTVTPRTRELLKDSGVLDMPIKKPHGPVFLPTELLAQDEIVGLVQSVVAFEVALRDTLFDEKNKDLYEKLSSSIPDLEDRTSKMRALGGIMYDSHFLYLTLHRSIVQPGTSQRPGGFHVDGLQGARFQPKLPNTHTYFWTSSVPTIMVNKPWTPPDSYSDNWFEGPNSMSASFADEADRLPRSNSGRLHFMSAYQIHAPDVANEFEFPTPFQRLFARAQFTTQHYDRKGNTVNPRLGWFQKYEERSINSMVQNKLDSVAATFGNW